MNHTHRELRHMTVAQLREIAAGIEHEAVEGYTQLHKEPLVDGICEALGIPKHEHHDIVGVDKGSIKAQIKALKQERDKAIEAKDRQELKKVRVQIKRLNRKLRKAMV